MQSGVEIMYYDEWRDWYNKILNDFGFDEDTDKIAAERLSALLTEKQLTDTEKLRSMISERVVIICGGAITTSDIGIISKDNVVISADDATSILMENNIVPDIIVTDLDGDVEKQIGANRKGAIVIIHAHGDNVEALEEWVPWFEGQLLGTTQSQPLDNVHNFGGFTDGDRAVFLASHYGAYSMILIGFDFKNPVVKQGKDIDLKKKKLIWAKRFIDTFKNIEIVD